MSAHTRAHMHTQTGTCTHEHSVYTKLILQDPVQSAVVTVDSISARPRHVQLVTCGKMAGQGKVWCFRRGVHPAQLQHHEDGHRHTAAQSLVHGSAQTVPHGSSQCHAGITSPSPGITSPSPGITRCCTFCSECCCQCFSVSQTCSVGDASGDDKRERQKQQQLCPLQNVQGLCRATVQEW